MVHFKCLVYTLTALTLSVPVRSADPDFSGLDLDILNRIHDASTPAPGPTPVVPPVQVDDPGKRHGHVNYNTWYRTSSSSDPNAPIPTMPPMPPMPNFGGGSFMPPMPHFGPSPMPHFGGGGFGLGPMPNFGGGFGPSPMPNFGYGYMPMNFGGGGFGPSNFGSFGDGTGKSHSGTFNLGGNFGKK